MSSSFGVPLAVFEEHVRQIECGVRFVQAAGDIKRCAVDAIDRVNGKAYAIANLDNFIAMGDFPEQQYCNANFISLVAGFEEFLRQTLESAVTAKARAVKSFDDLGTPAHDLHMKATGLLLTQKANPPQQLRSVDFFQICRNIGTCIPGAKAFTLNPEALSIQSNLLDLEGFMETLKKFGYNINWDRLGADAELKKCMGLKRTRDAANLLKQYLAEMVRQRNRVAHTGSSSDITPAVLEDYLLRLLSLARAIASVLR